MTKCKFSRYVLVILILTISNLLLLVLRGNCQTLAILPFKNEGQTSSENNKSLLIEEIISSYLVGSDIDLVERSQIQLVLTEQKLSLSGIIDSDHVIEVGKLLGAKYLLNARYYNLSNTILLIISLVNCETSEVIMGENLQFSVEDLYQEMYNIANKIHVKLTGHKLKPRSYYLFKHKELSNEEKSKGNERVKREKILTVGAIVVVLVFALIR